MPVWGRLWFRAGRLKKDPTLLLSSLRIMHRHCRTPPQDMTHPCDVSPFFPPLPFSSPHTLTSILFLPCFFLDTTSLSYRWSTFTQCCSMAICEGVGYYSQAAHIYNYLLGATANDSLGDAGKRPLSGLRCIDLNTTNSHTAGYASVSAEKQVDTHKHKQSPQLTQTDTCTTIDTLSQTHSHAGRKNFKLQVWVTWLIKWSGNHPLMIDRSIHPVLGPSSPSLLASANHTAHSADCHIPIFLFCPIIIHLSFFFFFLQIIIMIKKSIYQQNSGYMEKAFFFLSFTVQTKRRNHDALNEL